MPIKTVLICDHCGTEVLDQDGRVFRNVDILSSVEENKIDGPDCVFHYDCRQEWLSNQIAMAADARKPLIDCKFFHAERLQDEGVYEREGHRYHRKIPWRGVGDHEIRNSKDERIVDFCCWLRQRGWLDDWFEDWFEAYAITSPNYSVRNRRMRAV